MIYLSKGMLHKIIQRLIYWTPVVKLEGNNSIIFAENKPPIFLRIDSMEFYTQYNKVGLKLDDGEIIVTCLLDESKFSCLNSYDYKKFFGTTLITTADEEIQKLYIGSVIMLLDYTFEDLHLKNGKILFDILKILDFYIIGFNE